MTVCLQGGGEFSPRCRAMDEQVLAAAGGGPVVVTALAGASGREYDTATRHGVEHYRSLGADVVAAPDVRERPQEALDALRRTVRPDGLLVLPGGSPTRLLRALSETPVGAVVREVLDAGGAVSGSSAGAMVLGGWTVLPENGVRAAPALAVVPEVAVLPHWTGSGREQWRRVLDGRGLMLLGVPEESGLLVRGRQWTALGQGAVEMLGTGVRLAPGDSREVA